MHGLQQRSEITVRDKACHLLNGSSGTVRATACPGFDSPTLQKFNAQRSAMNSLRTERGMLNAQPKSVTHLISRESAMVGLLPNRPILGMTAAAGRLSS